ncbi:MAG: SDR family oxidoreductase [Pseudonocardiaceae bacterium]
MTADTAVALVTGANKGLGREIARQLAATGMTVLIGARDAERGRTAADKLSSEGADARYLHLDVTDETSITAAARRVDKRYGRVDILVNNAGILPEATAGETREPLDVGLFRQTFETNLFGAVSVIQQFLPLLRASEAGRIVNVSSTMGSLTDQTNPASPYYQVIVPAYQASKTALNGVTVALAKQLTDTPIKVNSVCPGFVQTELTPQNRSQAPLSADEAARVVVEMALIDQHGPTGQFIDRAGTVPW